MLLVKYIILSTVSLGEVLKFIYLCQVNAILWSAFRFNLFYHLWFLDALKASKGIIDIHIITSSLYWLPMYVKSNWWLMKLGRKKIVIIALLGYAINETCYSFLYYRWLSLVIDIINAFSFHLFCIWIIYFMFLFLLFIYNRLWFQSYEVKTSKSQRYARSQKNLFIICIWK